MEGTVGEIIEQLCGSYPDFQGRLVDDGGNLLRFVNMYVEDEDVRFLQGMETLVVDGQTISIIPAVAGGQGAVVLRNKELCCVKSESFARLCTITIAEKYFHS